MPKIAYKTMTFRPDTLKIINQADEIINDYSSQGYDLTLRQLYYQFVARGVIPNSERSYKRLGSIINDARLAGLIDWLAIEDRTRDVKGNNHWETPVNIIEASAIQYQIDKWKGQPCRIEVWVEKDALVGVISRISREMDVPYLSCRGYVSQSEMWRASCRLRDYEQSGQDTIILHLGDHDPSGIDMTRDITDRLALFGSRVDVRRIALTMEQVEEINPPPNPAKVTDARYETYQAEYGEESWELDALEPSYLEALIRLHVEDILDEMLWDKAVLRESDERQVLHDAAERIKKEI